MTILHKGKTSLHSNPFSILGVTTRDDRRRIVAQAEDRELSADADLCQKARLDLTNPRLRLTAELAWLPGLSPTKADEIARTLLEDPVAACSVEGLPTLARANVLAGGLELLSGDAPIDAIAYFLLEFAKAVETIQPKDVLREINEDRQVAGFPPVSGLEPIEEALAERRKVYSVAIKAALDSLASEKLVTVLTATISTATQSGGAHGPSLLDDLVDSYEVEAQGFLEKERDNLIVLAKIAREVAPRGETAVAPVLDQLMQVAGNWHRVARPIQLSHKSRGSNHQLSHTVAYELRSLGIDLFNEHDLLEQANRVTKLLQDQFSELPEVAERVRDDATTIEGLREERAERERTNRQFERDTTFEAEVGMVFKDRLSISPRGISWNGKVFPLEKITRVRYGATKHSVNGIPTGTDYSIGFGDNQTFENVQLRREATFNGFTNALWRGVCMPLMIRTLEEFKSGKSLMFGEIVAEDAEVTLPLHKFFGANVPTRVQWKDCHIWSADGNFVVGLKANKKVYGSASYKDGWNTHILEGIVRASFKTGGIRLSDVLSS